MLSHLLLPVYLHQTMSSPQITTQVLNDLLRATIEHLGYHLLRCLGKGLDAMLDHLPRSQYPGQALVIELYRAGAIRSVEIGSVMFGKRDPESGEESYADVEMVRLAIPRRVYTQAHMDVVAEAVKTVYDAREETRGLKMVYEPKDLRFFQARFEPIV